MWLSTASARDEDGLRDLPLAEAGDLDALGEVRHRVLDRVLHLRRRDLDGQADAVLAELFDSVRGHPAIQPAWTGVTTDGDVGSRP
jgi:hypothetical protein